MKKSLVSIIILFIVVFFLSFYRLDYYIMKPGSAYDVSQFVTVEDGEKDHEGTMSLMTVAMAEATPLTYAISYFKEFEETFKEEDVRQEEEDEEEYTVRQLKLMTDSQFNALYIAFQKANLPYTIEYHGVTVLNVLAEGAADGELEAGDEIVEVDGVLIEKAQELTQILSTKKENDVVELVINRQDKLLDRTLTLKQIPGSEKVGIGITYSESKFIKTEPNVKVDADKIGGPSAGLMFTLEILNQLIDEDLTKGYSIAGTGEMYEDGTVGRIGGIEKKVVAADKDGVEIFFAPDDEITEAMLNVNPALKSNYQAAVETAEKIDTQMEIVPVKTIDDALNYIEKLKPKEE
ncbi:PDZ domain-containing protein [Ureibacillus chungkukjangi]|uniref:endopeptidase La n=1 Tax=Ureibacillus chungkukjangi TaxID=1202712 RepID=A0A318TQ40_9BACL|nr:SepM family pheromone-processing serine protease [Ureibacillus chungkukjangi]MCM3386648.1 PDZ domain-containing protein [Ureibacillus chungkukjangi]PYF07001.1 PDZ domain-containing protein [Ureibacillus chungkukjangi]